MKTKLLCWNTMHQKVVKMSAYLYFLDLKVVQKLINKLVYNLYENNNSFQNTIINERYRWNLMETWLCIYANSPNPKVWFETQTIATLVRALT